MKNKIIITILITLLLTLTITNTTTATGTFTDLYSDIYDADDGSTITLTQDYTRNTTTQYSDVSTIYISKNITIDGNGYTLNSMNSGRTLYIEKGNTVTIKNLKIINSNISSCGSSIWNAGNLTVINCEFKDNLATGIGCTAGIYNQNGDNTPKLTVLNSKFINCRGNVAGALVNYYGLMTAHNNSFINCTSISYPNNKQVYDYAGGTNCDLEYNYWGSNENPRYGLSTNVFVSNWLSKPSLELVSTLISNSSEVNITATFKDGSGNALANQIIKFYVNNVYNGSAETNSNGVANITIYGLSGNSYTVKAESPAIPNSLISTYSTITAKRADIIPPTPKPVITKSVPVKKADLYIIKVSRKGNSYYVYVKNKGTRASTTTYVKIYFKKGKRTYYRTAKVYSIGVGKYRKVRVKFYKYSTHKRYTKVAYVNYKPFIKELSLKNNKRTIKRYR